MALAAAAPGLIWKIQETTRSLVGRGTFGVTGGLSLPDRWVCAAQFALASGFDSRLYSARVRMLRHFGWPIHG